MSESPHVGCYRGHLLGGKIGTAHRRHRTRVVLRVRHTIDDGLGNGSEAAVTPQPFARSKIGSHWGTLAVLAVTAPTGGAADFSAENLCSERDLLSGCAGRQRGSACSIRAGIRVDPLGWQRVAGC